MMEEEAEERRYAILQKLMAPYAEAGKEDFYKEAEARVGSGVLEESVCLVCLEQVGATEPIWSCLTCFEPFHIPCVQSWAAQACAQAQIAEDQEVIWCCPKCRAEYRPADKPRKYRCYCLKQIEPKPDPWLAPHSCGDVCGRPVGECGHRCLLLCHPGPCPPCPKIISLGCYCGRKPEKPLRCGLRGWSCGGVCGSSLGCGVHGCASVCHAGPCEECAQRSRRPCRCGRKEEERPCLQGPWACDEPCGKPLKPCGRHNCEIFCHSGPCPPCVEAGNRRCPCGKAEYEAASGCREDLPCCGDTCGLVLDCGFHECIQRCHRGDCPPCKETRVKVCRCGAKEKSVPCAKEFLCETKCRRGKQCGRHQCNRKCCDGSCPPCTVQCGERLGCGNHKCQSPCHTGKCYPCTVVTQVKCRCGAAVIRVPCGSVRKTKPPRCREECAIPPDCEHEKRIPHRCHFGDCPPCKQICGQKHPSKCGHICGKPCHSGVLVDVNRGKGGATPWETPRPDFQRQSRPCPPCDVVVRRSCRGRHEEAAFACAESRSFDCGRPCGQRLACGNHDCAQPCHVRMGEKGGTPCDECRSMCTLARSKDCPHQCTRSCHDAPCPPCRQMLQFPCHCGLNLLFVACREWGEGDAAWRTTALACGNQCPRELSCAHRCTRDCHPEAQPCSDAAACKKKLTVACPCKRISRKVICSSGERPACDAECAEQKRQGEEEKETAARLLRQQSSSTSQEVADVGGARRKRKRKQRSEEEDELSFLEQYKFVMLAALGALCAAAVTCYLIWT